jgi:hypothetical protein
MADEAAQLASLSTQTTINTVRSGIIIIISLLKPVLLEWIQRRYDRRQADPSRHLEVTEH